MRSGIILAAFLFLHLKGSLHTFRRYEFVDQVSEENWLQHQQNPDGKGSAVTGILTIKSTPQGASIIFDGEKNGLTIPSTIRNVPEGKHIIPIFDKKRRIQVSNIWYQSGGRNYHISFSFIGDCIPTVLF